MVPSLCGVSSSCGVLGQDLAISKSTTYSYPRASSMDDHGWAACVTVACPLHPCAWLSDNSAINKVFICWRRILHKIWLIKRTHRLSGGYP